MNRGWGIHPHPHLLPSREKGPEGAGMRGSRLHGNDGGAPPHLRPVCAPLSRTLDSSLRWNDGGPHPHPSLLPSREKGPEGAGMRGSRLHGNDGGAPPHLRPVCAPLSRTLDSSLRWNDGGHPHPSLLPSREKGPDIHTRRQGCEVPVFTGTTGVPLRTSAPCALRCRARWIPAFAGMTGGTLILAFSPQGRRDLTFTQGGRDARFPPTREDGGAPPHLRPVCAPLSRTLDSSLRWNDGGPHPHPNLLPSREKGPEGAGMRGSRLRWNDGGPHPHPSLLPSREKEPEGVRQGRRFLGGLRR